MLKVLKIKRNIDTYDISRDIPNNLNIYNKVLFGCRSIYIYKCYKGEFRDKLREKFEKIVSIIPKKYFLIQDMHPKTYGDIDNLSTLLNSNKINIIFTFFNNTEGRAIRNRTPNSKHYLLMHHIDISKFKIYNINYKNKEEFMKNKEYDILLFGSIHPKHYPFRKRLFELIRNNELKYNIKFIERPETFNPEVCEEGLSKLINKSRICISTKSRYDYMVGKYMEIPASGGLIVGDIPKDGVELLKNRIVEVNEKMTDEEIIKIIDDVLLNYEQYYDKIMELKNIVDKDYNLDKYITKLKEIIFNN
jgi:hypothetical protein